MKTLLSTILLSLSAMCCTSPNTHIKDSNPNGTQTITETVVAKDTLPDFIIADTLYSVYDECYVFLTCNSMQNDTTAKLSVCPILIIDTTAGNTLLVLESSNRKDMLKINICNIIIDGRQYPTYFECRTIEDCLEVVLFSITELTAESISDPKEVKFAFWGDYGSVMFEADEQQVKEFTTLIEYNK